LHSHRRSDDFRGGGNGVHDDDDDDVSFFDVCVCDYDGLAERGAKGKDYPFFFRAVFE
jgi:hypothetical protein